MRILFLDDDEERHRLFMRAHIGHEVTQVRSAEEAIDVILSAEPFDEVHLDHDLGGEVYVASDNQSGWFAARAIASAWGAKAHGRIVVHSFNGEGALNMLREFVTRGIPCEYRPFGCKL